MNNKMMKLMLFTILLIMIFNLILPPSYALYKVATAETNSSNSSSGDKLDENRRERKEELEKHKENITKNPNYNPKDGISLSSESQQRIIGNGDAPFETGAKEVRPASGGSTGSGLFSVVGGALASGFLMYFFWVNAVITGVLTLSYLSDYNPKTMEKYREAYEKDKGNGNPETIAALDDVKFTLITSLFSLDKLFFGDFKLLDVNIFKVKNKDGNSSENGKYDNVSAAFKSGIASWVGIIRLMALALSFIIFIVAIINIIYNMASNPGPIQIQKSKQLIQDLVVSIFIAVLIPFLLAGILYFNDFLMGVLNNFRYSLMSAGVKNFEFQIYANMFSPIEGLKKGALNYVVTILSYIYLSFLHIKFIIVFLDRLMSVAIMVIISPLIAVTYALDKAGDNKSQILNSFIGEFVSLVALAPLYALIYLTFMVLLAGIATAQPILGLIILSYFQKVERLLKDFLGIKGLTGVSSSKKVI